MHPIELLLLDDEPETGTGVHVPDAVRLEWFERLWTAMTAEQKEELKRATPGAIR